MSCIHHIAIAGLLLLTGCAAPDGQQRSSAARADIRQILPQPGANLLAPAGQRPTQPVLARQEPAPQSSQLQPRPEPLVMTAREISDQRYQLRPPAVESARPARKAALTPRPALPTMQLDLSLPHEVGESPALVHEKSAEQAPALPAMFGEKPDAPTGFELGGRLITGQDQEGHDSVEGAELQFRFLH